MTNWNRYCSITGDNGLDLGGGAGAGGLRCRFEIHQWTLQAPNTLKLLVTNPDPTQAKQFVKSEFKKIIVDAGYQDSHGVLFQGNIIQGIFGRESPTDTLLTIIAADGDHAHNYATVSTTFPPGSTPQQHMIAAMAAMQPYGVTQGYIGVDLSKPTYPRAVTLFGMARDVLSNIAKNKNASVSYQNEKMTMVPKGSPAPGNVIVLNSQTGMIGQPTQTTDAILVRCLINPNIKVHSLVQINQSAIQGSIAAIDAGGTNTIGLTNLAAVSADGTYVVEKVECSGDTRGNPWYMDLDCFAQGPTGPIVPLQSSDIPYLGTD